jgi:phosphoglycerate dehydrogenase-like enzyme
MFRDLPNTLITPHIGYNTHEASLNMLNIAIATIAAHLKGEQLHVVNPEAFSLRKGR